MSWNLEDPNIAYWQNVQQCDEWCSDCILSVYSEAELRANTPDVTPIPVYTWDNRDADTPKHCPECGELLDVELTAEGAEYVRSTLHTQRANSLPYSSVLQEWADKWPHLTEGGCD